MNAYEAKKGFQTFLLAILLLSILSVGFFGVSKRQELISRAFFSLTPKNQRVLSLTSDNATIFWTTDSEVKGFVSFGESPSLGAKVAEKEKSKSHLVVLPNLFPRRTYYYKIGIGDRLYGRSDERPFSFTTPGS